MNRLAPKRRILSLFPILLVVIQVLGLPGNSGAASLNLNAGYGYTSSEGETENRLTGQTSERSSTTLSESYNLNLYREIYPHLLVTGGGNFSITDTESEFEGNVTEVKRTSLRPYLELKVDTPVLQTGIGYQGRESRQETSGGSKTSSFGQTRYAFLSMQPYQLPELDLRFSRTNRTNDPKTTDVVEDQSSVHTRYNFRGGNLDYTLARYVTDNSYSDFRTESRFHTLKFQHGRSYLDGKVSVRTGYWLDFADTRLEGTGGTLVPKLRTSGLFSLDSTPEDGPALETTGGLIDGETTVPTSLDIGLAGDETTLTNIGLDLGFTTKVDTLRLWVDRDLSQDVSDSFTWYVYTSPDNTDTSDWQLHSTVSHGQFDTFDNRFEISFTSVETRYIKIAVMPLLPSVTGASDYPSIYVTELEALSTVTSQNETSSTRHRLDYNISWRMTEKTSIGYDWFFRHQVYDPGDIEESSMVNGLFVRHRFNRIFSGSARFSRRNQEEAQGNSSANSYNASIRANYMKTFWQTLTYSGSRTFEDDGGNKADSLFLRNNADLYRGISVYLDTGINWNRSGEGDRTKGTILRIGSKLVPNDVVTFNVDYRANRSQDPDGEKHLKETGKFQAFVLPSNNLSMLAVLGFDEGENERKTTQHYTLSWSPRTGGTVRFSLSYDKRFESDGNLEESVLSPGLSWSITRYASLRTSYRWSSSESDTQQVDLRSLSANLNLKL